MKQQCVDIMLNSRTSTNMNTDIRVDTRMNDNMNIGIHMNTSNNMTIHTEINLNMISTKYCYYQSSAHVYEYEY